MARLVVFAKPDNENADPWVNWQKYKRGMVVDILETGQDVGREVEASDWFRVIEAPGPASDYSALLGPDPEFGDPLIAADMKPFPRRRTTIIDLDAAEQAAGLARGAEPARSLEMTRAQVIAHSKAGAFIDNPMVI